MPPSAVLPAQNVEVETLLLSSPPAHSSFLPSSPLASPRAQSVLPPSRPTTTARIYVLATVSFGVGFVFALEFALTTPFFRQALQASSLISHIVFILGPISGFIIAPLVGYCSDRFTSSYGRRTPFIIAGAAAVVAGMIVFSHADEAGGTKAKIAVGFVGFGVMDFAVNTVLFPSRALLADLVEAEQQHEVQAAWSVMGSLGDLAANGLLFAFENPVSEIRTVFTLGIVVFGLSVGVMLWMADERAHMGPRGPEIGRLRSEEDGHVLVEAPADRLVCWLPVWLWRIGIIDALAFFCLFCVMPNASSWMGDSVLQGDPSAPQGSPGAALYEKGVNLYGKAGLVRGAFQTLYALTYTLMLRALGGSVSLLMGLSYFVFGVAVFALSGTNDGFWGGVVVVAMGIPMAAAFTIPMAVVAEKADGSHRGRYLGVLNIFSTIPQLIDTLYTGSVSSHVGEAWVMRIGGIWALVCAVTALWLR